MKEKKAEVREYEAPRVEIIEVAVEKGFAASPTVEEATVIQLGW